MSSNFNINTLAKSVPPAKTLPQPTGCLPPYLLKMLCWCNFCCTILGRREVTLAQLLWSVTWLHSSTASTPSSWSSCSTPTLTLSPSPSLVILATSLPPPTPTTHSPLTIFSPNSPPC